MIAKSCSKCKQSKPLNAFQKDKSKKDGLQVVCKICRAERQKVFYESNKDSFNKKQKIYRELNAQKLREHSKNYYEKNKEKESARKKAFYLDNKQIIDERNKQYNATNKNKVKMRSVIYYQKNKEKINERNAEYIKANPEKSRNLAMIRRSRKLANGTFKILKKELIKIYNSPCFYCGSFSNITADHIIPVSKGGRHSVGNLISACKSCNSSKHNKLLVEWRQK